MKNRKKISFGSQKKNNIFALENVFRHFYLHTRLVLGFYYRRKHILHKDTVSVNFYETIFSYLKRNLYRF